MKKIEEVKSLFRKGDTKIFEKEILTSDIAVFPSGEVHAVYSTFAITRDAEWACRLFVLEMMDNDEEGIGSSVSVKHLRPAKPGQVVKFISIIDKLEGDKITCSFKAEVNGKIIATGTQEQRILKKERLKEIFDKI